MGYPDDWDDLARKVKDEAGWVCENKKCKAPHGPGYILTVHHKDGDPSNCERENLVALCQRCHLKEQTTSWRQRRAEKRVGAKQIEMFGRAK